MVELLLILTPIGLLDGTTMLPICTAILIVLLTQPKPLITILAFFAGIFLVYLACGLALLFGLGALFDVLNEFALRVWQSPNTEELIFQILLGLVLCALGWRYGRSRRAGSAPPDFTGLSPARAMGTGAVLTIVGLPGAVPYFAAIDLILRDGEPLTTQLVALVFYNILFMGPVAAVAVAGALLGAKRDRVLGPIKSALERWGKRLMVVLLVLLGVLLFLDGVGWFLGHPLIPV